MPRADTPYVSQLSAALRASILAWRDALPPGGAAAAFAPLAGHERLPETEVLLGRLFEELGKFANVRGGAFVCAPRVEGAAMCLRPRPTYPLPPRPAGGVSQAVGGQFPAGAVCGAGPDPAAQ